MKNLYSKEYINQILEEQNLPYIKMSIEERNLCLKYLMLTYKFNENINIIQCKFSKNEDKYSLNGMGYIKLNENELLTITFDSEISFENNLIGIFSTITQLYNKNDKLIKAEEIETYDKFYKENNKIIRETYYFNPEKKYQTEYNTSDDFDRFLELSKINNSNSKQR